MTTPKMNVRVTFLDESRPPLSTQLLSSNEVGVTVRHMDKPTSNAQPKQKTLFFPMHQIKEIEFFSPLPGIDKVDE